MASEDNKQLIISRLKQDLLRWQGVKATESHGGRVGLGDVENVFPNGIFPLGCVHEFICMSREESAASSGFLSGLLASLMRENGLCLWISTAMVLFPPSVKAFGVEPHRIVFVIMNRDKDVLWAMEEALKCSGLVAVVAELQGLDFMQSRRLQLAVEKSGVTGFVLCHNPHRVGATTCAARWSVKQTPSILDEDMPGVGYPRWEVELLKVRNGSGGKWQVGWSVQGFSTAGRKTHMETLRKEERKLG